MPIRHLLALFAKPPPARPPARLIKTVQQLRAQRADNPALAAIDLELVYLSRCCEHYDDIADELRRCCEGLSALLLMLRHTENAQLRGKALWALLEPLQQRLQLAAAKLEAVTS
ncbi:hypothetical protein JW897_16720 [Chromobacterium alkanivorans]|uniref:hypothetical protein n=1 Tax=Chromobacterium alkanivorans TaxID=1071719 RepID=UPI001968703F|nr:hypothetical protein [Chromobacterium alkanivorans]MBN3005382.1 hypothetical protein [Chromobacterium alkanivorans]